MLTEIIILVIAGVVGGFVGGLVGVGGGLIFAPVLLFYFQGIGIPADAPVSGCWRRPDGGQTRDYLRRADEPRKSCW